MNKDLVIGVVGTLILLTAMVGVFRLEASQSGTAFDITWDSLTLAGPAESDRTTEGASVTTQFNVTTGNLTSVAFTLAWTDDVANSGPDEFKLIVTSPFGVKKELSSSTGTLTLVFDGFTPTPEPIRVLGADQADAVRRVTRDFSTNVGVGLWNVTVEMVNAGDQNAPVVGAPITADDGNDWELTTRLTAYAAVATAN